MSVTFDDDSLLPNSGLSVAALLAQTLGVAELVDEHVTSRMSLVRTVARRR